jgi:large subunit ribosomal protein L9
MAVKVILQQDVPNLGHTGEIKQVAPGYFRNFLLPRGLAVEATKGQVNALQNNKAFLAAQLVRSQERAGAQAEQLGSLTIQIRVKQGDQGRLYGSVTNKDIAEQLAKHGHGEIDRHKINLSEPLKTIGVHSVPVKLEHGVEAHVNVELVPESEAAPA